MTRFCSYLNCANFISFTTSTVCNSCDSPYFYAATIDKITVVHVLDNHSLLIDTSIFIYNAVNFVV